MAGESYCRRLSSLLLCLCDVLRALIDSLVCWFCTSALGLVLFQIGLVETVKYVTFIYLFSSVCSIFDQLEYCPRSGQELTKWVNANYWAVQWSWFAWVNALCNLSRKKSQEVAVSLPGRFLSRRCFTLCTTMEAEPRIAKQYKCHHCCSCKNYRGKGM